MRRYKHMMIRSIFILLIVFSNFTYGCNVVEGKYSSVSETHWNFILEIKNNEATLTYTDYWFGEKDARTDIQRVSQGYCTSLSSNFYSFKFAGQTIKLQYHPILSHKSYGGKGSSPGFTGQLIDNQNVELWLSK
jgi:hypothetical protein